MRQLKIKNYKLKNIVINNKSVQDVVVTVVLVGARVTVYTGFSFDERVTARPSIFYADIACWSVIFGVAIFNLRRTVAELRWTWQ